MKILTKIFKETKEETLSKLYIDGVFICYTLEDQFRAVKVWGDTRIPRGTYEVALKKAGGFYTEYLNKFAGWVLKYFPNSKQKFLGSLKLLNVPGFEEILLHVGNFDKDTHGCLLTGIGFVEKDGRITLTESVKAYVKLYDIVADELEKGRKVFITLQ